MMEDNHYTHFLERYILNLNTPEEYEKFRQWFQSIPQEQAFEVIESYARICENYNLSDSLFLEGSALEDDNNNKRLIMREELVDEGLNDSAHARWHIGRFVVAAMLIMIGTGILYLYKNQKTVPVLTATIKIPTDVAPGTNKAILTLGDGTTVLLDSAHQGHISIQSGMQITKVADGKLIYKMENPAASKGATQELYNTITTPKGGQYEVSLADGSKVWLNSLSTIRFPAIFKDSIRKVEITGEVYFEVAKDVKHPFIVKINNNIQIEVLGTHFNINSYADEKSINTTLLEGAVRVISNGKIKMLVPGQQAQVYAAENDIKLNRPTNVMDAIAWKNGTFSFADADLSTVMRQLARWYNVEVHYEGAVPSGHFNGKISRQLTLNQVLDVLTLTRVKYRIEGGNKIIVMSE